MAVAGRPNSVLIEVEVGECWVIVVEVEVVAVGDIEEEEEEGVLAAAEVAVVEAAVTLATIEERVTKRGGATLRGPEVPTAKPELWEVGRSSEGKLFEGAHSRGFCSGRCVVGDIVCSYHCSSTHHKAEQSAQAINRSQLTKTSDTCTAAALCIHHSPIALRSADSFSHHLDKQCSDFKEKVSAFPSRALHQEEPSAEYVCMESLAWLAACSSSMMNKEWQLL